MVGKSCSVFLSRNNEKSCFYRKHRRKKRNLNLYFSYKFVYFRVRILCGKITLRHFKFFYNSNYNLFGMLPSLIRDFFTIYYRQLFAILFCFCNTQIFFIYAFFVIVLFLEFCLFRNTSFFPKSEASFYVLISCARSQVLSLLQLRSSRNFSFYILGL